MCCVSSEFGVREPSRIEQCLFDGNYEAEGSYCGLLMSQEWGNIYLTAKRDITIFANSHGYNDYQGAYRTGGNLVFEKFNGTSWEEYETCKTTDNTDRYELVTLEKGEYRMHVGDGAKYVGFTEWEIE